MRACPHCGAEAPEGARFCAECGTALAAGAPTAHEVRKTVTILFSDVTGSTALAERLDAEAVRRVMARHFDAARTVIERHGGTVEKFIGDAVMAVFGIPTVHEDDALRAVRAAAELEAALRDVNSEIESTGVSLSVRTGINTGEVVAGTGDRGTTLVTGDAVNVAARLEQAAQPGEVLLGAETFELVRDAVDVDAIAPLTVKGKTAPVRAFRLTAVRSGSDARTRRIDVPMVGRVRELALLRQAFERASSDRTIQLFTVFGSAGVGKSRLIREFLTAVAAEAAPLRGRCLPYGDGITYWPIVEIIRAAAGIEESDDAGAARTKLDRLVGGSPEGRLIDQRIAQVLGLEAGGAPQEELFWAARKLLESLAVDRPLVVLIEDIHWAEPSLLDLVEHVGDLTRDAPILLVVSARPELLEERPTWGGGRLNATAILLEPLSSDAASQLIDHLVPGRELPLAARARIGVAAEGNPLYVEEVVAMLVDSGLIRVGEDGVAEVAGDLERVVIPRTIQALLAARLDRLGPPERSTAERASVIGRSFERDAVTHLSPEPERPDVAARLTSLVRMDLIRPEPGGPAEKVFRFRHILIRDAAYESLPKADRADLHERFADWLEATAGDRIGEVEEIVGYHLERAVRYREELGLATPGGSNLARHAADRLSSAAGRAMARSDARAATNLLERTVALLPTDDPARDLLLVDLGDALAAGGGFEAAKAVLADVAARALAAGDELTRSHAVVQGWFNKAAYRGREATARRDALEGIERFEAVDDDLGLARGWRLLADLEWAGGQGAAAEAAVLESMAHARKAGALRELGRAYGSLSAYINTGPTSVDEGINRCEAILLETAGDRAVEGWMRHALAHLRARLGEFSEARELAARSRAILDENGQLSEHADLAEVVADVEVLAGEPAAAVAVLEDGLLASVRMGEPSEMTAAFLARAAWLAGDPVRAASAAALGVTGDPWVRAIAQGALARVRAGEGDVVSAERLAREAVAFFEATDFLTFRGWVLRDLAHVLAAAGRRDDAIDALTAAIGLHERKGSTVEVAQAQAALGALRSAGQPHSTDGRLAAS